MQRVAALSFLLIAAAAGCQTRVGGTTASSSEWKSLFDGKTTTGWRNYRKQGVGPGWTVADGMLTRSGDNAGDLITVDKYRNFELELDWRVAEGGNSGIMYRGTEENDYIWQSAPEMQILDDARHADGKSELTSAGAVFALYPAPRGVVLPAGQWNTARLIVNGNHVEHWLNGKKLLEYELGSADWNQRVEASKFKAMPNFGKASEGHLSLQDHGDKVDFRNIRIRVLP